MSQKSSPYEIWGLQIIEALVTGYSSLSYIHGCRSKLQKISVALGEAPLPFPLFGFLVKSLEVSSEAEDHDDAQPTSRDTDPVGVSVSRTPGSGPHVRARDVAQLTDRVNERDSHGSF